MTNDKPLLRIILYAIKDIVIKLRYTGIRETDNAQLKRRTYIINTSAILTSLLIIIVSAILIYLTGSYLILSGAILECIAFASVIKLNKLRKHSIAAGTSLIIHCCFALYFGGILGNAMPIELLTVFLLPFLIGGCYLIYRREKTRYISVGLTFAVFIIVLLNNYYKVVEPIYIRPDLFYYVKLACWLGMVILMVFITFSIIHQNDLYIKENELLLAALEKTNKAKTEFIRETTHEIRTPLNAVVGISNILFELRSKIKDLAIVRDIEELNEASLTTLEIINHVLDMAKIEAGKYAEPKPVSIKIHQSISTCLRINKYIGALRNITINLNYASKLPTFIVTDKIFLMKVINNLVSNAVKFSPEKSHVDVVVKADNSKIYFAVSNPGTIKSEDLENIFQPFISEKNIAIPGTGLGLNIARNLVESLGGTLTVNCYKNKVTFKFDIPLITGDPIIEPLIGTTEKNEFAGCKAIIMEDDDISQYVYKRWCEHMGITYILTSNGVEGLALIISEKPDIVFCDYALPGLNGIQVVVEIRKMPEFKNLPVIIGSANAYDDLREDLLRAGASKYLLKPISFKNLTDILIEFYPVKIINHTTEKIIETTS